VEKGGRDAPGLHWAINCRHSLHTVRDTDQLHTELVAVVLCNLQRCQSRQVLIVDKVRASAQQQLQRLRLVVDGTQMQRCVAVLRPPTQLLTAHATMLYTTTTTTTTTVVAAWRSGNIVGRINEVPLRQARLVQGWVTFVGGQTTPVFHRTTQANSASYPQRDGK